ncbi:MAG: rod shape-determining protein RodA [Bacteroidales bacterium]|nr:rod shape-determining protein RodA [Bacteroidales bacterium]
MRNKTIIGKIDIWLLIIYLALSLIGLFSIYAAAFNEAHPHIYDMSQNYGKQLLFIGISLVVGFVILLVDAKFFNVFAYIIYGLSIVSLLLVLVVGSKISGSTSWIQLGPISFQPSEFGKFGTALALAHYLSQLDLDISKLRTKVTAYGIVFLPMLLVLAQGDAGSASVFLVFLFVIYREGMGGTILLIGLAAATLFIVALCISKWYVIIGLVGIFAVFLALINRTKHNVIRATMLLIISCAFVFSVDFAFNHVLKPHQRTRINIVIGKEKDTKGVGYNLNQSMMAIGSGGFSGKGYMNGTMTKYNYVPEQHTDFIFCTVGEEFGFVGSSLLILLYLALVLRLIHLAERQRSAFSRVYGYGIACIFFYHFTINIGMTIGLVPVIGIPLPFLSYGGTSLLMFSTMVFVFLKQDANRMNIL